MSKAYINRLLGLESPKQDSVESNLNLKNTDVVEKVYDDPTLLTSHLNPKPIENFNERIKEELFKIKGLGFTKQQLDDLI